MIKRVAIALAVVLVLSAGAGCARADNSQVVFTVGSDVYFVNNVANNMDAAPVVVSGRVLVPVRYLAQSLGISGNNISWNAITKTIVITGGNKTITLVVGSTSMSVYGGADVTMDVAPVILSGRTYLPASYIAQALGYNIYWNGSQSQVVITPQDNEQTLTYTNDSMGLSFNYPAGWTFDTDFQNETGEQGVVLVSNIDHGLLFVSQADDSNISNVSLDQINKALLSYESDSINLNTISQKDITVDGVPGKEMVYTLPCNSEMLMGLEICVQKGNSLYIFLYINTESDTNNDTGTVENIINSIKFTGNQ